MFRNNYNVTFKLKRINSKQKLELKPKLYLRNNKKSVIPLHIFQTWHTLDLPPEMKETVELLKEQNPEFTHYLYDDEMCEQFIKENFDDDILYSFKKLKPGAYKSDLWRLCILYIKGGIYLDIKYHCSNGFKLIELTDKEYFVKDRCYCDIQGIYNALLICMPGNKILYNSIKLIVENVKNDIYGNCNLSVTGPHNLIQFFDKEYFQNLEMNFSDNGNHIEMYNKIILSIYKDYRDEQSKFQKLKYYLSKVKILSRIMDRKGYL
jgi:hypothetical protein